MFLQRYHIIKCNNYYMPGIECQRKWDIGIRTLIIRLNVGRFLFNYEMIWSDFVIVDANMLHIVIGFYKKNMMS